MSLFSYKKVIKTYKIVFITKIWLCSLSREHNLFGIYMAASNYIISTVEEHGWNISKQMYGIRSTWNDALQFWIVMDLWLMPKFLIILISSPFSCFCSIISVYFTNQHQHLSHIFSKCALKDNPE